MQQIDSPIAPRWDIARTRQWYAGQRSACGFNYVPSTAVNSTEMWQRDTFDLATIDRELRWAADIGLNSCRVFLQYLVWQHDPDGLVDRIDRFLDVAWGHGISTMLILFDDCAFAGKQPYLGPQDEPVPGVHNSGWTPSPGHHRVVDGSIWPKLQAYIMAIVSHFARDERLIAWDLYNEPGNSGVGERSLPLLQATFAWARACRPEQPLTVGIWQSSTSGTDSDLSAFESLNETALSHSDIISFHNYSGLSQLQEQIATLKSLGRPLMCTEWMSRTRDSLFETHLPLFHHEQVGCYFWGLVNGRTQTHYPWGSPRGATIADIWFHDLLDAEGRPHVAEDLELIRAYVRQRNLASEQGER